MSCYVISDIHGCYDTFMELLDKVNFSDKDSLYILGDIIDRGPKNYEVYLWIKNRINKNVFMIKGNHEEMFIERVKGFYGKEASRKEERGEVLSQKELECFEFFTNEMFRQVHDPYKTIKQLRKKDKLSFKDLFEMVDFFESLPYYYEIEVNNKKYTLVHACCSKDITTTNEDTFLWSRDFVNGKYIKDKNIIFGHTPTVSLYYNYEGNIQIQNIDDTSSLINVDCGCVWNEKNSALGLLRLDDMECIYQKNIDKIS